MRLGARSTGAVRIALGSVLVLSLAGGWANYIVVRTPELSPPPSSLPVPPGALRISPPAGGAVVPVIALAALEQPDPRVDVDGAIHLDTRGVPLPDLDMRQRFDHVLSLLAAHEGPDLARVRLRSTLSDLTPAAASRVMSLFGDYLRVREGEISVPYTADVGRDLKALATWRRREIGDALADAWFGDDEVAIRRRLDARRRAARSEVPTDVGNSLTHAHREPVSDGSAGRQAIHREKLALWKSRMDDYLRQRSVLLATLPEGPGRVERLDELRNGRFQGSDRRRAAALARIADAAATDATIR